MGYGGVCVIGESLRQGMLIMDSYNTDKYAHEKLKIICNILKDVFECEINSFMDVLCMMYGDVKIIEKTDQEYIRLLIKYTQDYKGYEDCIKLRVWPKRENR